MSALPTLPLTIDPGGLDALVLHGLSWTLRATAVLALAWIGAWIFRHTSAATRHGVWLASMAAVLSLPLFAAAVPWRWELTPPTLSTAADLRPAANASGLAGSSPSASPGSVTPSITGAVRSTAEGIGDLRPMEGNRETTASRGIRTVLVSLTRLTTPGGSPLSGGPGLALLLIWGAGTALALGFLGWGRFRLAGLWSRASRPAIEGWEERIRQVSAASGVEEDVHVLESVEVSVPLTVGVLRRGILLPAGAASQWPSERLDAVLLHEFAHVRRRDVLSHLLGRVICALHWFNPLVWFASGRMTKECERACDDLVLLSGTRPSSYAEHLLDVVRSGRHRGPLVPALSMARKTDFEGRIFALLDPDVPRGPMRRSAALATVCLVAALALLVSVPRAEGDPRPRGAGDTSPTPYQVISDTASETASTAAVRASLSDALSREDAVEATLGATLVGLLDDPHARVRAAAARSLGDRRAASAIPELLRALEDPENEVREEAAVALGRIEDRPRWTRWPGCCWKTGTRACVRPPRGRWERPRAPGP